MGILIYVVCVVVCVWCGGGGVCVCVCLCVNVRTHKCLTFLSLQFLTQIAFRKQ